MDKRRVDPVKVRKPTLRERGGRGGGNMKLQNMIHRPMYNRLLSPAMLRISTHWSRRLWSNHFGNILLEAIQAHACLEYSY